MVGGLGSLKKLRAFRQIAARLAIGKEPLAEPQDPMLGGLGVWEWFQVFSDTHAPNGMGSFIRQEWPDGGAYLDQPAVVPVAIQLVRAAFTEAMAKNAK